MTKSLHFPPYIENYKFYGTCAVFIFRYANGNCIYQGVFTFDTIDEAREFYDHPVIVKSN